jgi:hypothetical protein
MTIVVAENMIIRYGEDQTVDLRQERVGSAHTIFFPKEPIVLNMSASDAVRYKAGANETSNLQIGIYNDKPFHKCFEE